LLLGKEKVWKVIISNEGVPTTVPIMTGLNDSVVEFLKGLSLP
jgi:hypothetical protein